MRLSEEIVVPSALAAVYAAGVVTFLLIAPQLDAVEAVVSSILWPLYWIAYVLTPGTVAL